MRIWFHKIPFYHLNERILWKLYLLYTDYLISQKYKKCSPGKYAMLLYVAVSIRWISIRFDAFKSGIVQYTVTMNQVEYGKRGKLSGFCQLLLWIWTKAIQSFNRDHLEITKLSVSSAVICSTLTEDKIPCSGEWDV